MKKAIIGIGMLIPVCVVCGSAFAVAGVPHSPLLQVGSCSNGPGPLDTPYGAPATSAVAGSIPIYALMPTLDNPVTSWPAEGAYDFCAAFDTTACALGAILVLSSEVPTFQTLFLCATDMNGPLNPDPGAQLPFIANGIPDGEFELGLLAAILNRTDAPHHAEVTAAFQANYNCFRLMVTAALANLPLKLDARTMIVGSCGPYLHTGLTMILAGYATEGDPDTLAALDALIAGLEWLGLTPPAGGIASVTTGLPGILGPDGDANGDGFTNRTVYNYSHQLGAAYTIMNQLGGPICPTVATKLVISSGGPGTFEEGDRLEITATVLFADYVDSYSWSKDGVPLCITTTPKLVIPTLAFTDSGVYGCFAEVTRPCGNSASSHPLHITVVPADSLPVTGGLGLALIAGACALGGAGSLRRRR